MKTEEYTYMFNSEDAHWWYRGLRGMLSLAWAGMDTVSRARVIDVGCGTGANLMLLGEKADAFGLDCSSNALNLCRARGLERLTAASALALPFADDSFDIAVSCDVLYHHWVSEPRDALREMWRVLCPGGRLILNLPAYQWLKSSHDREVGTIRRFTKSGVAGLLDETGFIQERITYWNTLLFPAAVGLRVWRKFFPIEGSDLAETPSPLTNRICGSLLKVERALVKRANLPFGVSVFAVARKTGGQLSS